MPSRLHLCTHCLRRIPPKSPFPSILLRNASTAASSAVSSSPPLSPPPPPPTYPSTQPPSHRSPEYRRSQLHRQYTSLLRSSPLLLIFQHSNLKALEWVAVRRELELALRAVDESLPNSIPIADRITMNVIQRRIFEYALLVVDHFRPDSHPPSLHTSAPQNEPVFTHALSRNAYESVKGRKWDHPLHPLLCGPVAALSFPVVSVQHLKAALSILSPQAPLFPAPSRRTNPGYYDPVVQGGLQKLLLLGARVEGKIFDIDETRWVGSIEGGMEGLRAQLVGLLGSFGAGVTGVLETAGRSLYYTLEGRSLYYTSEGRKGMLEEVGAKDSKILEEEGAKDTLLKEENTKDTLLKEENTKGTLLEEEGAKETLLKEEGAKDTLLKEEDTKDTLLKEEGAKDTLLKEEGAKDTLLKEEGAKDTLLEEDTKDTLLKEEGAKDTTEQSSTEN